MAIESTIRNIKTNSVFKLAQLWRAARSYRFSAGLLAATLLRLRHRSDSSAINISADRVKQILIIRLDAMGDVVMATSIFRELKLIYPDAYTTAVVQRNNRELLETNPYVDRVLYPPTVSNSRMFRELRREVSIFKFYGTYLRGKHFDLAIQPRRGIDYFAANLLLKLVDASISMKYVDQARKGLSKYLSQFAYRSMLSLPETAAQHEVTSTTAFLVRLIHDDVRARPEIFLTSEDREYAKLVFSNVPPTATLISITFGAQAPKRIWPIEKWAEAINLLAREREIFASVLCSDADRDDGERLQTLLNVNSCLIGGARIREVAACIEASNLFLGPDSGLAHIAAAVGCSVLVVSPHPVDGDPDHDNSPVRFRPFTDKGCVLQPSNCIAPCHTACDALEPHCILQIHPDEVAQAAEKLLRASDRTKNATIDRGNKEAIDAEL